MPLPEAATVSSRLGDVGNKQASRFESSINMLKKVTDCFQSVSLVELVVEDFTERRDGLTWGRVIL